MVEPPLELKPNIDEPAIEQANVVEPDVEQPNVVEPAVEQPNIVVNTDNYFFQCEKYKVRDEMIEWCRKEATKAGFTIVIGKSDNGGNRRKPYFLLSCSRGGVYKENKRKLKKQDTATKTLKCLFRLRGYFSKKSLRGEMSEMQQLLKCCETHKYFYKCRTVGESKTIQDFFWAHPESVKLFNTFPTVLMMDSTYKTNKYKMSLFEIVGVTSTEDSFNVGYAFIANEKEDNFIWTLETCKSLLKSKDTFPNVIVTDRDKSLMNVVPIVFPNSTALVCRYHVAKNVRAKFKAFCGAKEKNLDQLLNTLTFQWESIVQSSSEESYTSAVAEFRKVFEKYPNFLNYVETTVLDPVKENLVSLWTNRVMHIGNTTTNRVESQHGVLKEYVTDCKGNLVRVWDATNQMLSNQLNKIKTSFGQSTTGVEHHFRNNFLYSKLVYNISRQALHFIRDEINTHWKRLQIGEDDDERVDCSKEFNAIQERLNSSDYAMNLQIRDQLRQIAYSEITSLTPPVKQFETKGSKKGESQLILPPESHRYGSTSMLRLLE
ncbi:hypothetical protein TSUD_132260 [Trifolium subterraneum]|uniref:MULE transposase domain-containing protein n=1 Tax=Trifolium subterraneum TaxID=3900 RepID=A0A2Z6NVP6_TRISU|nr:hypothetical protein TSUD_132260 [Trifolium subterraneum]